MQNMVRDNYGVCAKCGHILERGETVIKVKGRYSYELFHDDCICESRILEILDILRIENEETEIY